MSNDIEVPAKISSLLKLALKLIPKALRFGGGYPLLLALAGLMDFRRTVANALPKSGDLSQALLDGVDYLLFAEWFYLLAAARMIDWREINAGPAERAFGLALACYGLFGVGATSHWMTTVACFLIAAKLATRPGDRWLSAALVVIGGQYVLLRPEFDAWQQYFAGFDTWAVHHLLTTAGFANDYRDCIIELQNSSFAIEITPGCATSKIIFGILAAFFIFSLCWRTPISGMIRGVVIIIGASYVLNWLRLSLMVQSPSAFHFWHIGTGASIVSAAMAAIAYLTAAASARPDVSSMGLEPVGPSAN